MSPPPTGYLSQDEAIKALSPWVTQRAHIKQEFDLGRLGREVRDWIMVGRRRFYKEGSVDDLKRKYKEKKLTPARYEIKAA